MEFPTAFNPNPEHSAVRNETAQIRDSDFPWFITRFSIAQRQNDPASWAAGKHPFGKHLLHSQPLTPEMDNANLGQAAVQAVQSRSGPSSTIRQFSDEVR